MSLKVEFVDNSSSQYDENAGCIKLNDKSITGKLYLGDRFSSAFLQLKSRSCKYMVSCSSDMHGFCKESDVKYLKIDPEDEREKFWEDSFTFILNALQSGNNVTVNCETGNQKSALIVLYFVMKHMSFSLAESYKLVRRYRPSIRITQSMGKIILKAEKKLRGFQSMMINEDRLLSPIGDLSINPTLSKDSTKKKTSKVRPSVHPLTIALGTLGFFGVVFAIIYSITGKI